MEEISNTMKEFDQIVSDSLDKLIALYKNSQKASFPYEGCRKLLEQSDSVYEHLISDLDLYFSEIAGYCSWGKRIPKWPREKMEVALKRLSVSFFAIHPQYKPLEKLISEVNTPDLHRDLLLYEDLRSLLMKILSSLLQQPSSA